MELLGDCRQCGTRFIHAKRSGTRSHFCSNECRETNRKAYHAEWCASHKEQLTKKLRARQRRFAERNPSYWQQIYAANKERKKTQRREWYRKNKERALRTAKAYTATHVETIRACGRRSQRNRRAKIAGVFVESVDAAKVFRRDKGMCGICKKRVNDGDKWEIDHVIPISKGGRHSYSNVQLAHERCNRSKGAKLTSLF